MSITWEEALERVRHVAAVCTEGNLERLRIEESDFAIDVRRSAPRFVPLPVPSAQGVELGEIPPLSMPSSNGKAHVGASVTLTSDFVGIVRFSRPVVSEGSTVSEDRELAYVESLGTRNPIRAAGAGKVCGVHVVDGQPVDYGHPLFAIAYDS